MPTATSYRHGGKPSAVLQTIRSMPGELGRTLVDSKPLKKIQKVVADPRYATAQAKQVDIYRNKPLKEALMTRFVRRESTDTNKKRKYLPLAVCLSLPILLSIQFGFSALNLTPSEKAGSPFKTLIAFEARRYDNKPMMQWNKHSVILYRINETHAVNNGAHYVPMYWHTPEELMKVRILTNNEQSCYLWKDGTDSGYLISTPNLDQLDPNLSRKSFADCLKFKSKDPAAGVSLRDLLILTEEHLVIDESAKKPLRLTHPCVNGTTCGQMTDDECRKVGGRLIDRVDVCTQVNMTKEFMGVVYGSSHTLTSFFRIPISTFVTVSFVPLFYGVLSAICCSVKAASATHSLTVLIVVFFTGGAVGCVWASFFYPATITTGPLNSYYTIDGLVVSSIFLHAFTTKKLSTKCFIVESMTFLFNILSLVFVSTISNASLIGGLAAFTFGIISSGVLTFGLSWAVRIYSCLILTIFLIVTCVIHFEIYAAPFGVTFCRYKWMKVYCNSEQDGVANFYVEQNDSTLSMHTEVNVLFGILGKYGYTLPANNPDYMTQYRANTHLQSSGSEAGAELVPNVEKIDYIR
ncbi:MAG: hypothetical protein MHMPM18_000804 [Marteilia pararefringens]